MSKTEFEILTDQMKAEQEKGFVQVDEPDWEKPRDDHEYVIAVGKDGTAIFMITPLIHETYFENARDHLDDNGFAIPEGLGAGIYKCHFRYHESTDWESGMVDDWGFDCIGEPELLCSYEEEEKYEDNS
jgi:hypothetical protein